MKSYEIGKVHHIHSDQTDHYIEVWRQPFSRWAISKAYHHLWEKWSEPIMRRVSKWHRMAFEHDEWFIPLLNRRDLRCYNLVQKKRTRVAFIYITQEQYDAIAGRPKESGETP
jgi:hypothetical protein